MRDPGEPLVELADVHKFFGDLHVLRGVTTQVRRGEVIVIIGPSGSGKSTLLRCIHQLERIDRGWIKLDGVTLGHPQRDGRVLPLREGEAVRHRRQIGMVFQQFNLFPHMTAIENVMAGPVHVLGVRPDEARREANRLLTLVGLPHKAHAYPDHLSGGQQQRVAIARALAMRPKLMLFDEPTSALDPEMIKEVLDVMLDLSRQGMTMIVVTHEMGFARAAADRIVFMDEGRFVEEAPPTEFFSRPRSDRTRQFLSKILH
ncbi:MAG TPA: amino acid ABC transporter ATP-binding protein [bacterium]|nr:amino acid ABC transporter ATP-binding protein [bacterium]